MIYNLNQHRINQEHRLIGFLIADFSLFFDADTQSRIRKYFQGDCERYRAFLRTLKAIIKILKGLDEIGLNPCFYWMRRWRDSNSHGREPGGFQDRCLTS